MATTIVDREYSNYFLKKLDNFTKKINNPPELVPEAARCEIYKATKYRLNELKYLLSSKFPRKILKSFDELEGEIDSLSQVISDEVIQLLSNYLAPQRKSGFDINDFFQIFDKIKLKPGKALDYVLYDVGIGGGPLIYSRDSKDARLSANQYLEKYGKDQVPYLKDVCFDIKDPVAHFQFSVFTRTIHQFFLSWHSNYDDTKIVANFGNAKKIINKIPESVERDQSECLRKILHEPKSLLMVHLLAELQCATEYDLKVGLIQHQAIQDTVETLEMMLSTARICQKKLAELSLKQLEVLEICIKQIELELYEIQSLKEDIKNLKIEDNFSEFSARLRSLISDIPTSGIIPILDRQRLNLIKFSPCVAIHKNWSIIRFVTFSNWQGFAYEYSKITFHNLDIQRRVKVLIPYDCGICF